MVWFAFALAIYLGGGLLSFAVGRSARLLGLVGAATALLGGAAALGASIAVLLGGRTQSVRWAWSMPLGSVFLEIDPLSAVFLAAIAVVTTAAAVYGGGYLSSARAGYDKKLAVAWFFFQLLSASMMLVVAARNGVLFLICWELMSLASFFLVMFEDDKPRARRAGWTYLVAMHLGTAFLLALFALLGKNAASLDFDHLSPAAAPGWVFFALAMIGFGTKAGFIPMHVWLPEAHPAAPSHVSAVMSGVMIKTGVYGLLRVLVLIGPPEPWWGWTLVAVGVVSGLLGVIYALAQHDLKRLLAYHSVENIGIIAMGLGVGYLGVSFRNPAMAALGFAGGLLHVVNHALFKSLLFLGAGAVLHGAGTAELDRLGGLLKRMPTTGATFLIGAAAISGLPPLNGFVSELMIYLGAAAGLAGRPDGGLIWLLLGVSVVGGLALIGGLAAACFAKAFGIVFLGEARSAEAASAHEAPAAMRWPMIALAGLCAAIGLSAPLWPWALRPAVAVLIVDAELTVQAAACDPATWPLAGVVAGSCMLLGLVLWIAWLRRRLLAGRSVERAPTWDCGYALPTPRMQYTASSFAAPIVRMFQMFLQPRDEARPPDGLFPENASLHTHAPDLFRRCVYEPLFALVGRSASKLRWLQEGRIQFYVLYIALTILVLFIWKLR